MTFIKSIFCSHDWKYIAHEKFYWEEMQSYFGYILEYKCWKCGETKEHRSPTTKPLCQKCWSCDCVCTNLNSPHAQKGEIHTLIEEKYNVSEK